MSEPRSPGHDKPETTRLCWSCDGNRGKHTLLCAGEGCLIPIWEDCSVYKGSGRVIDHPQQR
jgi:hypothetical protein